MGEILYCKYVDGRYCRNDEFNRLRAEVEALRKALDKIKVRAYELGVEEIHDMALATMRGEEE